MKYAREIKVGLLTIICLFLLFFGFNFLKGINIFTPTNAYQGKFVHLHGLEQQSPVYISGYKVGQVDLIEYDYTQDTAFAVYISINEDVALPQGTTMALVADGIMGGMAIELQLATNQEILPVHSTLPTAYQPGIMDAIQTQLLVNVNKAVTNIDSLIIQLQSQIQGDRIKSTLNNLNTIAQDLTAVSAEMKHIAQQQMPSIIHNADSTLANMNTITTDVKQADIKHTISQLDTTIAKINTVINDVQTQQGTIGKLLYDTTLYQHIDATILSADSLITDIKKQPKKYINMSVFGK